MNRLLLILSALFLAPVRLFAWTDGELLIWMDSQRGRALEPIANKFQSELGIKVTIETPEQITDSFPIAAQAGKGPDVVIWAHDKVGEWAGAGLISQIDVPDSFLHRFFPKAWQAVTHGGELWGYPIALETVTLIYNKALLNGRPPLALSQLPAIDRDLKRNHPGVTTILWDPSSPYYSWGILASAGGFVFARNGTGYDLKNVGICTPGTVAALTEIVSLIKKGILPKVCSYSETEDLMGQGKLAMMISGPWAWSNLVQKGIDFGLSQIPGVRGQVGRPLVGVSAAVINRSSPNQDLAKEFIERDLLTDEGLADMNNAKPLGVPALVSFYDKLAQNDEHLRQLKASVDAGQVMPNVPQMGQFFSALSAALQLAADGRMSASAALRQAESNLRHGEESRN
ncbi:MAG TPA: maltose/maltodextrin ABC transporter substrate-binding protein MalE [Chthoniobacterales bacterium]|nr:maltose/maltodextrin ABC transporter substrate-binding protein MalE [Chthoniobacterales bacterium]